MPVDWPGLLLLSGGLLCLLFGFTRAGDVGWTNGVVIGSCLAGIVILLLFVMTERRVRWPLVNLALSRNSPFVINTTLPSSLATSRAAANQFIVSGAGINRLLVDEVILQGFKLTALACLILCGGAAVCALFMPVRATEKGLKHVVHSEEQSVSV